MWCQNSFECSSALTIEFEGFAITTGFTPCNTSHFRRVRSLNLDFVHAASACLSVFIGFTFTASETWHKVLPLHSGISLLPTLFMTRNLRFKVLASRYFRLVLESLGPTGVGVRFWSAAYLWSITPSLLSRDRDRNRGLGVTCENFCPAGSYRPSRFCSLEGACILRAFKGSGLNPTSKNAERKQRSRWLC